MKGVLFVQIGVIGCLVLLQLIMSTEVIFERTQVDYFNKKYLSNVTAYVRRTGRKSPYYWNVELTSLVWMGDNVTIHAVFHEFLHNEYKRGFVELEMNMCDIVNKEPWRMMIGAAFIRRGFVCPTPPGTYRLYNVTTSMINFRYVWPFEKVMLDLKLTTAKEILARWRVYATFKRDIPKGKLIQTTT